MRRINIGKGIGTLALLMMASQAEAGLETVAIAGQDSPGGPGVFTNDVGDRGFEIWNFADDGRVAFQAPLIATANYPADILGVYVYESGALSLAAQLGDETLLIPSSLAFVDDGYLIGGLGGEIRFVSRVDDTVSDVFPSVQADQADLEIPAFPLGQIGIVASKNRALFLGVNSNDGDAKSDLFVWEGNASDWSIAALDIYEENQELGFRIDLNDAGDVYSWSPLAGHFIRKAGSVRKYGVPRQPTPDGRGTFPFLLQERGYLNKRGEILFQSSITEFDGDRDAVYLVDQEGEVNELLPDVLLEFEEGKRFARGLGQRLDDEGRIIFLGAISDESGQELVNGYGMARIDREENLRGILNFEEYDAFAGSIDGNIVRGGPSLLSHAGNNFAAFHWVDRFSNTQAIYMYDFDTNSLRRVIELGVDVIDGSVVESIEQQYSLWVDADGRGLGSEYINSKGEVVFVFELEDGRRGIARWSPDGVLPMEKRIIEVTGISAFSESPKNSVANAGGSFEFSVAPANADTEVRWKKNGVELQGRRGRTLRLENLSASDNGSYQAFYEIGNVRYLSEPAELTISDAPVTGGKLINLSTRGYVGEGADAMFAGFVVENPTQVLIRASSQVLTDLGLGGAMNDPILQLFKGQSLVATNDTWSVDNQRSMVKAIRAVGAFEQGEKDAAILIDLDPGVYSAQVSGNSGDVGLAIVEVYEVSGGAEGRNLVNLSTRGQVGVGANAMFAGFVLDGPKKVLIRASSQILADLGLEGAMADPVIEVFKEQSLIAENDDWSSVGSAEKGAASSSVGAFAQGQRDAAVLLDLEAGVYSIQITGFSEGTGLAIVEVYDLGGADIPQEEEGGGRSVGRRSRR